jgi:hypothetical protein
MPLRCAILFTSGRGAFLFLSVDLTLPHLSAGLQFNRMLPHIQSTPAVTLGTRALSRCIFFARR